MIITRLKSKIHRARVTGSNLDYEGSITIDTELLKKADIKEYEQVHIYNVTNGERFITYVLKGATGVVCINGAAAHKAKKEDIIIIVSYGQDYDTTIVVPRIVYVDSTNRIISKLEREDDKPYTGIYN